MFYLEPKTEEVSTVSGGVSGIQARRETAVEVLRSLAMDPWQTIILKWNWKSAVFSSLIRANIFFFVTLRAGWRAALGAFSAEMLYRVLTSGFYGAITQAFRSAEPAWAAAIATMVLLPLTSHSLEFAVHFLRHTPNLRANLITSVCFTAISTLFNWYAMRNGALVTGAEGRSVGSDMARMPLLIGKFLAAGPVALWKVTRPLLWPEHLTGWNALSDEPEDAASD